MALALTVPGSVVLSQTPALFQWPNVPPVSKRKIGLQLPVKGYVSVPSHIHA